MPSALRSLGLSLITALGAIGLGACGDGASGQATSAASKSSRPPSFCPSFQDVSTAVGVPVTLKTEGGSQDSFLCGYVYHVTLHSGPLSSVGDQKDAMVRVVKLMMQAAPAAQRASGQNVCALATSAEFNQAYEDKSGVPDISSDPMATDMSWGPHCDYEGGSIDLFQTKPPGEELERVLGLMEAGKQPRVPVAGLGQRA